MESSIHNTSTSSAKSVALSYEMDTSNEEIDQQVLRDAGEQTINAEWSATVSALNSSDTTSSNSYNNIETLKECCANPSDTLKDKEDFMVIESSSTVVNISKFNDTKYYSECKTTAFQKKHKPLSQNVSRCFENILDDDSQMEITQSSICLNRFQKRKRLIPPNDEDFIEINNSNYSGSNSMEVSMTKSPKFSFSRKKKDQFEIPDYNLSASDSDSIANETNISKRKENASNCSLVVNDNSNNMKNASKTEVFTHKFSLKTIGVADSVFENIINNSSIISDITLNNKKTSLNETALSNVNNTSVFSKMDLSNLNHTYDIPNNTNSTSVNASIVGDADIPKVKQNAVFKKPSNLSILVNDNSNNIMDTSKTEVLAQKFSKKSICVPDSAFDNIIDDSSMTSNIGLNNMKTSLNETSVSNINNSKMNMSHLNYTYDIPTNINTPKIDVIIAGEANIPKVKQNTDSKKPSNLSIVVNDSSNNIIDVSKPEVLTHKFSRKTIDVADSVFDNIINNSSILSDITLNHNHTFSNEPLVSNVNKPVLNKIDMSNLNHTYDIPTNINTSTIDVSIAGDANIPKVKQNTDLKIPSNLSIVVNDSSNNVMDVSKPEVLTHKFSRKTIDVTHSVFDNIINDSSMTSDITLNNKKVSLTETSVSNDNTPVFGTTDVSNSNYTYDIPMNNNTTLLDAIVEHDKNMSETPVSLQNNRSKSFNLRPLKFNFTNKFGRHSLSLQEHSPSFDGVKQHNISLNTDFSKNSGEESNIFLKSANISNLNLKSHPHFSIIREIPPLDDPLLTNTLNQEQLQSKHSISSNSNNEDFLLSNTTTKSLESNEFQKNQSKHSMSSTSSNEGLTLLNSTTGLLGSCSSSRTQSRLLTSKQSNSSTSNNDTLNSTMESLDRSQNDQSKHLISSTSNNEDLTLTNSTTGFSGKCSSSRNKSTSSEHSTSVISNHDSLTSLNATTEISLGGRSSRNQSKHSTSVMSKNDNLTLLNTTMDSLKSNETQKTQSKRSISSDSYNEGLTLTNSTTEYSERCSSSTNNSSSSEHSTSVISNHDSLTSLNTTTEISLGGRSSRNQSKHSTSVMSQNDNLTLLNTTMESLKSNESQKTQSKSSISRDSFNESLKSSNSTTGSSGRRSSSRNKSSSTSSKHSTSVISNNDDVMSLNDSNEISVSGRSSRNQSKHLTSVISNNDNLTMLNTSMESLKSNESQKTQSKRSISPISYNESLKSTNSTTGSSGRRSSSRNKSSSTSSKHSTSTISKNDSVTSLNDSKEISVGGRSLRNRSKHSTSVISNNDNLTLLNTSMESLKSHESQKTQSKRSISPTSCNESLKSTNSSTGSSGRRSSSRNKSSSTSSKHSTSTISKNDSVTSLNDSKEISVGGRSSSNRSKHSTSVVSNKDNLTLLNTSMESLKSNESQKTQSKRSISPDSYNESLKSTNSTTGFSGRRSSSRNKSSLLTSKHSTSVISNSDSVTSLNVTTEISVGSRSSKNQSKHLTSVISNHDSLPLLNAASMGLLESNESPKTQSTSPTLNIENLTTLNTTTESLKQNVVSINGSISKHSSLINSGKISVNALGDVINNVSRMSTRSSKRKSNCLGNVEPITSIIIDGLSNSDGLTIKNTTTGPLEQKILSINQLNSSPNISTKTSTNELIQEDDTNNISKMYASSSKQKNKSYDDIEQLMSNITDGPLVENRPSKTRVLRSSLHINKNKSLPTKSLTSENDVNNLSIGSTRTSNHMANFNNETFDNNSDNSLFWTTLPDESTNISIIQNVNMNTFQTPKRNKLSIAENIVNTIKIMSTNKQKSTHPGAFELDDHNDGPLTRSLVTRSRSCNRSPSILTVVFGGQKTSESTSSLTQSPSEIIFDQSQVEENVKQKFKSLYKKESWITKRLYKFLIIKLQPNYNIYAVKYAEKFVKYLAQLLKQMLKDQVNLQLCTDMLRYHMARYHIIKDTFDYLGFLTDYIPMEYYNKLVPGWNFETSAVKFDPQKYYIPLMDDEEFLIYIMEHLNEA
ncbi:serine-rich adhesin for platelets-like [Metopolophium dirhodum]|uniref:serine-rich adhesin for platelets-like n=1 Tax=Metopolophium dirhodum TaxID=44670 RepID=UPI002990247A|nr:serine-rich adhesin for platelets-like [Metopolophium dirhodum]